LALPDAPANGSLLTDKANYQTGRRSDPMATAPTNNKDRTDALMQVANFRLERWKSGSDTEWKMTLAFWGLLVAASILSPDKLPNLVVNLAWPIPTIVALGYIFLWIRPIWLRGLEDQREAIWCIKRVEEILGERPVKDEGPPRYRVGYVAIFQTITTIVLVFYTWWAISKKGLC
jgi:hypothetical protein